ncbi:MAG: AraC family transcriptional regulator [Planctomycetota bacterium]
MPNLDLDHLPQTPDWFVTAVREARRFVLPPDQVKRDGVLSGGVEVCGSSYLVERSAFPFTGIEFVASGDVLVQLGDQPPRTVGPGGLICYDATVPHQLRIASDGPAVKYFVDLQGPKLRKRLAEIGLPPGTIGDTVLPHRVLTLFEELIAAGMASGDHAGLACTALLEAMLHTLADSLRLLVPDQKSGERRAFVTYQRLRRTLETQALQVRSLSDVAATCGVSTSYACRLFRRFDRDSPHRRLLRVRMSHAAGQLRTGERVIDVARSLGYGDPAHFSRAFKQVFGASPTAVRLDPRPG